MNRQYALRLNHSTRLRSLVERDLHLDLAADRAWRSSRSCRHAGEQAQRTGRSSVLPSMYSATAVYALRPFALGFGSGSLSSVLVLSASPGTHPSTTSGVAEAEGRLYVTPVRIMRIMDAAQ